MGYIEKKSTDKWWLSIVCNLFQCYANDVICVKKRSMTYSICQASDALFADYLPKILCDKA